MRVLLAALGLALVAGSLAATDVDPRVRRLTVTARRQASTVWIIGQWRTDGAPDSIITRRVMNDTVIHRLRGTVTRDSFAVPAPAPGGSIAGTFGVRAKRRGLQSNWATRSWSYTEPDVPPPDPIIDSLFVRPVKFTVEATPAGQQPGPKNQHPVCALVGFQSGHVGFRRVYEGGNAYCDSTYRALPPAVRAVTEAEQAMADALCVDWSQSTGGTVTPELCPGQNPAARFAPNYRVAGAEVTITPATPPPSAAARRRRIS